MCPPTPLHVDALESGVKELLLKLYPRKVFGTGASPRGMRIFLHYAINHGLVSRNGYFTSGQPRFVITSCGERVSEYLIDKQNGLFPELWYRQTFCPLEDYHFWEEDHFFDFGE